LSERRRGIEEERSIKLALGSREAFNRLLMIDKIR